MDLKILAIIPARVGSKGVPGKNIKQLGEIPLIVHSIRSAKKSTLLNKVIVSTDGNQIAEVSRLAGAEVPFLRPKYLAKDDSPTIDTVIHAIEFFQKKEDPFDGVCILQPTVPFRNSEDIDQAILKFYTHDADSLISVKEVPHQYNPMWTFLKNEDGITIDLASGEKTIISRRQELPKAYHRDGSIYIAKTSVVLKDKSLYGDKIIPYECQGPTINIDTFDDWDKAQELINSHAG